MGLIVSGINMNGVTGIEELRAGVERDNGAPPRRDTELCYCTTIQPHMLWRTHGSARA